MSDFTIEDLFNYRRKGAGGLVDAYEQLQQRNAELETQVRSIALSRDELSATVERYERAITDALAAFNSQYHLGNDKIAVQMFEALDIDMDENYESTLNAVKRGVAISAALTACRNVADARFYESDFMDFATQYANTKYPSDKE